MQIEQRQVAANDMEIAYLACGDEGPLAVCLHGFPDSAWTWRHLLPELAAAGYRAVAPWLRGYAPTSLDPQSRYQNGASVADVVALHDALGGDAHAVLIGHDWGARIATGAAVLEPARWSKLVTMAVPPGGVVAAGMFSYAQLKRSFYMWLFQTPLADFIVPMNDLAFIDGLWADWSPGFDAAEDLAHVKDALRDPAHLSAAIGYYRATISGVGLVPELQPHEDAINGTPPQPHLYLHGKDDGCMGADLLVNVEAFLPSPGSRFVLVEHAGHFLQLEQPREVNDLILTHLRS
jgi:pimeloyl-ACP methyl ester carboxylesterase